MKSKVYQVSDEEFKTIIKNSFSYSDCLRALGLGTGGGSSTDVLKKRIQELECSTEHFNGNKAKAIKNYRPLEEILIENSDYISTVSLKKRLIDAKLLEYKCSKCGISEWQGEPLTLQLDHINGNHTDNRIENLRLLCPNCHSQTHTYAGKNAFKYKKPPSYCALCGKELKTCATYCPECAKLLQRKVERPSREELKQMIRTIPFTKIGSIYNVQDNSVRKWCDNYHLPRTKKEINNYSDEEWETI